MESKNEPSKYMAMELVSRRTKPNRARMNQGSERIDLRSERACRQEQGPKLWEMH